MKIIITTVGTSLLENAGITDSEKKLLENPRTKNDLPFDYELDERLIRNLKNKIFIHLKPKKLYKNEELDKTSAEIKSIYKIIQELNEKDIRINLIVTDTLAGRICAEILEEYFIENFEVDTNLIKINNLQVYDSSEFELGVSNFISKVYDIIESFGKDNILLNPTGGFKSLVPYISLLGMIKKIPIFYIFENNQNLIKLLPLPINFSIKITNNQRKILIDQLYPNGQITFDEFKSLLEKYEEFLGLVLFEDIDNEKYVSLNTIGKMLIEDYLANNPEPIVKSSVSPEKKDRLRSLKQEPKYKQLGPIREYLKNNEYVEYFSSLDGANPDTQRLKTLPDIFNPENSYIKLTFGGIVLKIKTTAKHPKQLEIIKNIIEKELF